MIEFREEPTNTKIPTLGSQLALSSVAGVARLCTIHPSHRVWSALTLSPLKRPPFRKGGLGPDAFRRFILGRETK